MRCENKTGKFLMMMQYKKIYTNQRILGIITIC